MNKHLFIHTRPKNRRSLVAFGLRCVEASIALGCLWVALFIGGGSTVATFATVVDALIFVFWMGREAASFCGMWLLGDIATYRLSGRVRSESVQEFAAVLEVARRKAHLCTTDSVEQLRQTYAPDQVLHHVPVRELANIRVSRTGEIKVIRRRTQFAQPELVPSVLALFVEPGACYSVTHQGVRRTWLIHSPDEIREQIETVRWRQLSVGVYFNRRQWRWSWFVDQHGQYTRQTICSFLFFELRWIYPVESLEALLEARAQYEHDWDEKDGTSFALSRLKVTFTRNPVACPPRPALYKYAFRRGKDVCRMSEYRWRWITITKIYRPTCRQPALAAD